jgi:hypothetical protein
LRVVDDRVRIEIGFEGSQFLRSEVTAEDADRLERHLRSGSGGIVELEVEDGRLTVVLDRVLYLKRFAKESQIGFTGRG